KASDFYANFASEKDVKDQIQRTNEEAGYISDPHTAVAAFVANQYKEATDDQTEIVIASTASPYKFPLAVLEAAVANFSNDSLEASLQQLKELTGVPFPNAVNEALHDP